MNERCGGASLAGVAVGGGAPVRIMAVLNASPESFYKGSVGVDAEAIAAAARRYADEGADFIDIGAMSTAPYLDTQVAEEVEVDRMVSAVEAVSAAVDLPISADSTRPVVAAAALAAGARIVNDVNGLRVDGMAEIAAQAEGVVLMASPPTEAKGRDEYATPIDEVRNDLEKGLARAQRAGVARKSTIVDPGIGFYRNSRWSPGEFSISVLANLATLEDLDLPILIGLSRKSFLGDLTGRPVDQRLAASLAATALAVYAGCAVVRTHDIAATRDAVRVAESLRGAAVE